MSVQYTRRQFLQYALLTGGALGFSRLLDHLPAQAPGQPFSPPAFSTAAYLEQLDFPQHAPLNHLFSDYVNDQNSSIGLVVYQLNENRLLAAAGTESPLPVASAFKSAILMFFLDQVPAEVWTSLPVRYWNTPNINDVPEDYRAAYRQHFIILNAVFRTIVLSDNRATGVVLAYIARQQESPAPITLFNDWAHEVVGISQLSGIGSWNDGLSEAWQEADQRYLGRTFKLHYDLFPFNNLMTARDLGLFYTWWYEGLSSAAYAVCAQMLSSLFESQRSNVERAADASLGVAYSKNGSLSAAEIKASGPAITDAGVIQMSDGNTYLISFLSVNAERKIAPMFAAITDIVAGRHKQTIQLVKDTRQRETFQQEFYANYLAAAYRERPRIVRDSYNYAFVKHEGIDVYLSPDGRRLTRNPIINSSRFGVHLLMQGALVRYQPADYRWAQLIPDTHQDNIRQRLGDPLFVRRTDLHPLDPEYVAPIPTFGDGDEEEPGPDEKLVIVNLSKLYLVLLENAKVVLKTPVITNPLATVRGSYVTTFRWLSSSMQPWAPGVPFTTYFHEKGYALHGSPWQRWETTVNRVTVKERTSAGCINLPNWTITVGDYTRPADELIFRWLGGISDTSTLRYEYGNSTTITVRVLLVDELDDLYDAPLPNHLARRDINWRKIIRAVTVSRLTAIESYFNI